MLFNSYIFILLFLPLTVLGYFGLNRLRLTRAANIYLIGMSMWFYGYYNPSYLAIICSSILFNFAVSKWMERLEGKRKKAVMVLGVAANIALIFWFKYRDFFVANINAAFDTSFIIRGIVLPLGISFFTFQQISYVVDSYRGETAGYKLDEYALFVSFFPQLVAGPIVLHGEMLPQIRDAEKKRFSAESFAHGLFVFAIGLFKKVLIADTFGKAVALIWKDLSGVSMAEAWLTSIAYTLQLYFDFSGYCDMAVGIGRMLNFELPQNFDSPHKALSISEFWNRWHMSLTRFLRTYVYFPLGGSRKGKIRTYLNVMAVYLVSGLWHGANWTFILWGALHGVLNCLNRAFAKQWDKLWKWLRWLGTFVAVDLLLVIFRAGTLADAFFMLKRHFSLSGFQVRYAFFDCFSLPELLIVEELAHIPTDFINLPIFFAAAFAILLGAKNTSEIRFTPTVSRAVCTAALLVWSIMSLAGISTFLYFDF